MPKKVDEKLKRQLSNDVQLPETGIHKVSFLANRQHLGCLFLGKGAMRVLTMKVFLTTLTRRVYFDALTIKVESYT